MRATRSRCALRYPSSQPRSYVHGSGQGRHPLSALYMSSSGITEWGSSSSATDGSITCSMNTPSPGWAAIPIQPSPHGSVTCVSAMRDPPPLLPSSTTASAPGRRISAAMAATSTTHFSWRQSVSLFMYLVPKPSTAYPAAARSGHAQCTEKSPRGWEEDDRGSPWLACRRSPQDASCQSPVWGHDAHGLAPKRHPGVVFSKRPVAESERTMFSQRSRHVPTLGRLPDWVGGDH